MLFLKPVSRFLIVSFVSLTILALELPQASANNAFQDAFREQIYSMNFAYNQLMADLMPIRRIAIQARDAGHSTEEDLEYQTALQTIADREDAFDEKYVQPLVAQYAWGIPNDYAIKTLQEYSPLVEIGAGGGYWASLIAQDPHVDIVAYDNYADVAVGQHPVMKWFDVSFGTETAVILHQDRTLFLCWPPQKKTAGVAFKTLNLFRGQHVIYVGELPAQPTGSAATGDPDFFRLLQQEFQIIQKVSIPNWPGYADKLYVFKRKEAYQQPSYIPFRGLISSQKPEGLRTRSSSF